MIKRKRLFYALFLDNTKRSSSCPNCSANTASSDTLLNNMAAQFGFLVPLWSPFQFRKLPKILMLTPLNHGWFVIITRVLTRYLGGVFSQRVRT